MWCIDAQEEVSVRGSYDTEEGRIIKVLLEKCDQYSVRDDLECKSEEEIEEYFSDKYFLLLSNQVRFESEEFSNDKIVKESLIKKIKINTQMRYTQAYRVSTTQLELQDMFVNLNYLTEEESSDIFRLEAIPMRPYEEYNDEERQVRSKKNLGIMGIDI